MFFFLANDIILLVSHGCRRLEGETLGMHSSIMNKKLILPVMERSVYIIGKEQVPVC